MNNDYLYRAQEIVEDPRILAIVTSRRAKQLALGARPMVKCDSTNHLDIALLEIAEGKLSFELSEDAPELTAEEQVLADAAAEARRKLDEVTQNS